MASFAARQSSYLNHRDPKSEYFKWKFENTKINTFQTPKLINIVFDLFLFIFSFFKSKKTFHPGTGFKKVWNKCFLPILNLSWLSVSNLQQTIGSQHLANQNRTVRAKMTFPLKWHGVTRLFTIFLSLNDTHLLPD